MWVGKNKFGVGYIRKTLLDEVHWVKGSSRSWERFGNIPNPC